MNYGEKERTGEKKSWGKLNLTLIIIMCFVAVLVVFSSLKPEIDGSRAASVSELEFGAVKIPDKFKFAGEEMPLDRFDVREALDRELLSNAYFHSQTIRYLKLAPRFFPVIEPILKEKGIPDDFKYLALAESGFNPRAVSAAGAVGFWQFLKTTGQEYGLEINNEIDERYHIEKSTAAACDFFLDAYRKYGSWTLVAASFNGGMARVQSQQARQKTNGYYDLLFVEETQRYVFRIAALKLIMENPEDYKFRIDKKDKYPVIKTREVEINGPVNSFADFATEQGINYKLLKDFNPWLRDDKLTNTTRKKYLVKIPVL